MLLMIFWGFLGLVLGALGGFLGALLVPLRALGGTLNFQNFFLGLPYAPILPPEEPPTAPSGSPGASWRGKWPHEATKAHLETYLDLFVY